MAVLIYSEIIEGKFKKSTFELASYANEIAKKTNSVLNAVAVGSIDESELKELGKYGVQNIYHFNSANADVFSSNLYSYIIQKVVEISEVKHLLFSNNEQGRSIAPYLSVKLNSGFVPGVVEFPQSVNPFVVKKKAFSGNASADIEIKSDIKILSLNPNTYSIIESPVEVSIEKLEFEIPSQFLGIERIEVQKNEGKLSVTDADVLVSGGRGMKKAENWGILEELAETLGAATSCSKPVSDLDWRPHYEHVGQTGKAVAPNLYIAVGISGAIQHMAGVNASKCIVAINSDPDAPVFETSDYGVVGDAFEVVPRLNEIIKQKKGA